MYLQKENLDLAFKTGESVGITATLVRHFTQYTSDGFKPVVSTGLIISSLHVVTDAGGDAEDRRAGLAEGPGLRRKHFPSL